MIHFVTTLTNNFTPALEGLLLSLRANAGCDYRFTVVTYDRIEPDSQKRLEDLSSIEWVSAEELGCLREPGLFKERMRWNFQKPVIFNLPYDHNMIYIDADIVCVDSIAEMQQWEPITAVREWFPNERPGHYDPSPNPVFNCGVYAFRQDKELLSELSEFYARYERVEYGEQRIFNDFIGATRPQIVKFADYGFNWRAYLPGCTNRIRLVHYAHDRKPWNDEPATAAERLTFDLYRGIMSGDENVYETFRRRSREYLSGGSRDRSQVVVNETRRWRRKKKRFHRRTL